MSAIWWVLAAGAARGGSGGGPFLATLGQEAAYLNLSLLLFNLLLPAYPLVH
jgi:Zn-dependent protease